MKTLKLYTIIAFSIIFLNSVYSQGSFSVHVGSALPISDFQSADTDIEVSGGAKIGLNCGLKYRYPITDYGLGVFGGVDFNYNGLQKSIKEQYEELYGRDDIASLNYTHQNYYTIPISAGLNYNYYSNDKIGVFADLGLVLNYLKISDFELETNNKTTIASISNNSTYNVGFKVGGGLLIKDKISFSVNYMGLGEHEVDGEITTLINTSNYSENFKRKLKVSLLTFTIGFII